jgi:hypothetical protein
MGNKSETVFHEVRHLMQRMPFFLETRGAQLPVALSV